jgi:predicted ATPase
MAQLSRYVLEPLWDDGNFVLYRGTLGDEREPVLVLAAASERPPPWIIARLEHTYALREELEPAPVARPLRLVQHQGSPALLMEDPGGELLVGLFGRRRGLSQFLRVAINVAEALQRLHLRGIIHRDVKPANILVNLSTGEARLVGACFVSRLPRGQLTVPAEEIAATMAYMAPEQTGRVNRSVDARSDLYSFGVTLYEMFTGSLPFTATDPLEWIHCQIARQPTRPDKRVPEIPKPFIDGQLMLNLLPELELVIGKQPPVPELPLEAVQNRVQMMWLRLLRVFARAKHILVLFLDDLQWLDRGTLDLLNRLVNDPEVSYLLLIGAYRDNEVPPSHPLALTLERIRRSGAAVNQIVLEPLSIKDMERLVTDALDCGSERVGPFARLLHAKTGGNPFFAIQLLTALAEEGLLVFDRRSSAWTWDLLRIQAKRYADDVVELMSEKLKRLPHPTQWALKQLACLGSSAKISTLKLVYGQSDESIHAGLWDAVRAGLVFSLDGTYAFLHDRVQEVAYSLIPEGERAATHLQIGRLLASSVASDEIDEEIFEIVNQLNRARPLITSLEERERLAQLNFIAGKRAKTAEAYASALNYFAASESFLAEDSWVQDRRLAFDVSLNLAECEFRTGQLAEAETRLSLLSERAANRIEASAVVRLHAALCMTRGRFDQALDVCLEYLRRAGVELPQHPRQEDVEREYTKIWQQVGGRAIEELVDLPLASGPEYRATLDVLSELTAHAWYTDQNLHDLVVAHTANMSLEHGNSDASCYAYAVFGSVLGSTLGQYQVGFRFGQLGLDLVEKRGLDRFKARVYSCFGHHIVPWTRSLREGRAWIRRALDAAKETGDLPFAVFGCANLISNLFAGGNPLEEVEREAENALEFTRRIKFGLVTGRIKAQLSLVRTLRGLTPKFGWFSDTDLDESQFEQYLESDPRLSVAAGRYWLRKLEARFYANDFATAIAAAANVKLFFKRSQSFLDFAEYPFYAALAHAALSRPASSRTGRPLTVDEQVLQREEIASHHRRLAIWQENCPENFGSAATLVAAEIARIDGRELEAGHLYEEAIQLAQKYAAKRDFLARSAD